MQLEYETPRLLLKVLKADNTNATRVLDFYLNDKLFFERYEPDRIPNFYTHAFQKSVLKFEFNATVKGTHIRYYVFRKEDPDVIIGTICFHEITRNYFSNCELGYKFATEFHHHGYAREAIGYALTSLFTEEGIHRVQAFVEIHNAPSIRLVEKLGFEQEGICHDYIKLNGKWSDHYRYSYINPFQSEPQI